MNLEILLKKIAERLVELGISEQRASTLALNSPDAIRNWRRGHDPRFSPVVKLCDFLEIPLIFKEKINYSNNIESLADCVIPHHGDIAAGGSDAPEDGRLPSFSGDTGDKVPAPTGVGVEEYSKNGGLLAVTVRGSSMQPKYCNGDYIYMYKNAPDLNNSELLGKDCAITLTSKHDHAVYLKCLRRPDNGEKSYFNLESINKNWDTMVNIPVKFALPVRFVQHKISLKTVPTSNFAILPQTPA